MRALLLALLTASCTARAPIPEDANPSRRPQPEHSVEASIKERSGGGELRYLGFDVEGELGRGQVVTLAHAFEVVAPFVNDPLVQVHGEAPNGVRTFTGDHRPVGGALSRWKAGEFYVDRHQVRIADDAPNDLTVFVALFDGKVRQTVEARPGLNDGHDRIRAGRLSISGPSPKKGAPKVQEDYGGLPVVRVPRVSGATVSPDGELDEAVWAKAAKLVNFSDTLGRPQPIRNATRLRLAWDHENLYVAFEATDPDISCPYNKRDDPIYDHETVELFLMPNVTPPRLGKYIELQASPKGVIFDASFTGRRQGMNPRWNGRQTVGTRVNGSLNQHGDHDLGWVSEWVVPFAGLAWVSAPPKPGDVWRMNAFRIDKTKRGDGFAGEYSAWSPPEVGDFHNVEKFGVLRFD